MRPPAKFELDVLKYLAEHPGLSVREIFQGFGEPRMITRGTVVKTMDRLLKKGLVSRSVVEGTFVYGAVQSADQLQASQVASFIKERLGGSIRPIAAFLADCEGLDPAELREFKKLLQDLPDE